MLLTVLLLCFGAAAVVYTLATPARLTIASDRKTAAALAEVRDALIGWSASRIATGALPNARPGELPCPDANNDGFEDGSCAAGAIGRVPWRSLGIPEPKDGSGETLWYAVSGSFRIWNTNSNPINSDTAGQLTITGTAPAANVIAIVFSPGTILNGQDRGAGVAACASTGTNITANLCATNYLEGENGDNFADLTYVTAAASETFNDTVLPLMRDALFRVVDMRVARELRQSLQGYYTANQFYPLAAALPNNTATSNTYRGYVPTAVTGCLLTPDLTPYFPGYGIIAPGDSGWFVNNNWHQHVAYAVAPRCTPELQTTLLSLAIGSPQPACALWCLNILFIQLCLVPTSVDPGSLACNNTGAGSWLTVSGTGGIRSVVMPAGHRLGTQVRPCAGLADCLEDAENTDADDTYVRPVRSATNSDTLTVVAP
jgi:hypothetical protein